MGFGKRGSRADSMRGVDCVESTSFVGSKHILESLSFLVWSELVRYLLLLGVDLFIVLRRERPLSLEASTRSDGLMSLLFSGQVASVLARSWFESSIALSLPLLLSLRRSRIPLALRFLTAELRNRDPLMESLFRCADGASAGAEFSATEYALRTMLLVSICRGTGALDRMPVDTSWAAASSSLQPAGVGGTVSRLVPRPGGRLVRGAG
jgi:hypothetical protein